MSQGPRSSLASRWKSLNHALVALSGPATCIHWRVRRPPENARCPPTSPRIHPADTPTPWSSKTDPLEGTVSSPTVGFPSNRDCFSDKTDRTPRMEQRGCHERGQQIAEFRSFARLGATKVCLRAELRCARGAPSSPPQPPVPPARMTTFIGRVA